MEKAGRDWADSLADGWCCISCWPMPGFSGKGICYGNTIPVFPHRTVDWWFFQFTEFCTEVLSLLRLMSCTAKDWKYNTAMQSDIAWSAWFVPGFIFQMLSLTLQFPLQWRCFVSEGLSFPWAVLRDPIQHPVESGGKEESWEIGRRVARKGALAKRRGLPDCLNSHWTEEQGGPMYLSNLQIARNTPKLSFEMS